MTSRQLHSTPNATASAALDCLSSLVTADERKIHGQVLLEGEYYGVSGACGAPVCLRRNGWHLASADPLTQAEAAQLRAASAAINATAEGAYGRFHAAKTTA